MTRLAKLLLSGALVVVLTGMGALALFLAQWTPALPGVPLP